MENVIVYREPGRYGGWPANHGIWVWGDEILVGFEAGYFFATEKTHAIDRNKPEEQPLARSLDGGRHWAIEKPESLKAPPGTKMAGTPVVDGGKVPVPLTESMDFSKPGFAMTLRMESAHIGPSRFYYSYDKGHTWRGPFVFPSLDQPGIMARTDYIIDGPRHALVFVAAANANKDEGRPMAVRTTDGGLTWNIASLMGPVPEDYSIMPSTVRISSRVLASAIRRKDFIEIWRSEDNAASWQMIAKTDNNGGNPPSMVRLKDTRLVLTYGYRLQPYGIRARISKDGGRSWGEEIVLRSDGGSWDLGYPRTVQRKDGKLVTVYYFADSPETERYIAATIWDAGR